MLKHKKNLKKFLIINLIILNSLVFTLSSCSTRKVVIQDNRIMVHWIKQGEKAPFDGILLNKYTFERLEQKAKSCSDNFTK